MYPRAKKLFIFILCTNCSSFFPMNPCAQEYTPNKKFIVQVYEEELLTINESQPLQNMTDNTGYNYQDDVMQSPAEQLEKKIDLHSKQTEELLIQKDRKFQNFLNKAVIKLMH